VGRLEPLLAAILAEDAGCFESALEATVQLFECLALSGLYEQVNSFSGYVLAADDTNVACALTAASRIVLNVELDLLPLLERVELARAEGRVVEEDLTAVIGTNEAEPAIADQANDWTRGHGVSLLCRTPSRRASTRATGEPCFCIL